MMMVAVVYYAQREVDGCNCIPDFLGGDSEGDASNNSSTLTSSA